MNEQKYTKTDLERVYVLALIRVLTPKQIIKEIEEVEKHGGVEEMLSKVTNKSVLK